MRRICLLAALCLAGCSIAPGVRPNPEPPIIASGTFEEAASAASTTIRTPSPSPSISATAVPFNVRQESLPVGSDEILYWRENDLRVVGLDGSHDRHLLAGDRVVAGLPEISPTGRYLAISAWRPFVLDLQTGEVYILSDRVESAIASFFWVPGDILYYVWQDEAHAWKTWRVAMPDIRIQDLVYDPPEGSVHTGMLDDAHLILSVPAGDTERQSMLLNWRDGAQRPLAEPGYSLVGVSQNHSHAIVYGPRDGLEGGWVAGFYVADFSLEGGVSGLRRILPTPLPGSAAAMAYGYHPTLSPDGRHVIAERLLAGGSLLTELVLIELFVDGRYQETSIAPREGWLCQKGLWLDDDTVIASCRERGREGAPFSLWRIPLGSDPAVRLATEGYPG